MQNSSNHTIHQNRIRDLIGLIESRRSIRHYHPTVPEQSVIDRILQCAAAAPNAHNAQPWRFYLLDDRTRREKLVREMAGRLRDDMEKDGVSLRAIDRKVKQSLTTFGTAPVLIVVCLDMTDMHRYPDERRISAERMMGIQSVAAAVQNLLLAAHAYGLGGCWYCAPLFCPDTVRKCMVLPEIHEPQTFITLGYPYESPSSPPRKPIHEIRFRR